MISEFYLSDSIAGAVTNNTGYVKRAKKSFDSARSHVCASPDQAHVVDLLMRDIGEIE